MRDRNTVNPKGDMNRGVPERADTGSLAHDGYEVLDRDEGHGRDGLSTDDRMAPLGKRTFRR